MCPGVFFLRGCTAASLGNLRLTENGAASASAGALAMSLAGAALALPRPSPHLYFRCFHFSSGVFVNEVSRPT